ncbi:MAG: hypothetical protein DRR06_11120 [Gammaproteobacteria bacterium]|nr:MAG: hypothetical protein DRR06_11120 [Gammaproteobacteria bacterium]RLA51735.1 MAG: hypothetical protein DRR42_09520 [Gammaproteobacteria bacterium]
MNKPVNPIVAAIVILYVVLIFGLKYWFEQQSLELPRPSLIQAHPQGGVVILLGLTLYHVDEAEGLISTIDLGALEITEMVGDFAFFANGDLLIRAETRSATLEEELMTARRLENQNYNSGKGQNMLYRCVLADHSCIAFTQQLPALSRTFRLHIDWSDDRVYLADTSRHRVLAFDKQGVLQSGQTGFKFPNQLRIYEDKLWVADTNHHSLSALSTDPDNFGETLESYITKAGKGWAWPSAFVKVGEDWWVDIMSNGMSDGKIIVFDQAWQRKSEVLLPDRADPIALEVFGKRVLISDWQNIAVYQFNQEGVRLPDLDVAVLSEQLSTVRDEAKFLNAMSQAMLALFVVSLMSGFFIALKMQKRAENEDGEDQSELSDSASTESTLAQKPQHKIPPEGMTFEVRKLVRAASTVGLPLMMAGQAPLLYLFKDQPEVFTKIGIPLLLLNIGFIAIWAPLRRLVNYQLRVYPNKLLVTDQDGQRKEVTYERLVWSKTSVMVKGLVIQISNPQGRELYKGLDDVLEPLLNKANKINEWTMFKHRWHSPDGVLKSLLVMVVFTIAALLYLEKASLLALLESFR